MRYAIFLSLLFFSISQALIANNIQVSNVSYTGDVGDPIYQINFDVAWENSWRTSTYESNYDAAWIFVKYRGDFDNIWIHGAIESVTGGSGGMEVVLPSDGRGFFLQRSTDGIGDVSYTNIVINWDLDFDFFPDEKIEVCVYAIEMVFVPEGPFQAGDGFIGDGFERGNSGTPFTIQSEGSLTLGGTALSNLSADLVTNLLAIGDDFNYSILQVLPSAFPKGYQAIYMMKFEISQGQYASFLNTLTATQRSARFQGQYNNHGQTIHSVAFPNYYLADAPERACNYLSWVDLATYADWCGLRPMTELEFEKACRGPEDAVLEEYAWGTERFYTADYLFESEGSSGETISNPSLGGDVGNCINGYSVPYDSFPRKCGLAAASFENPSRQEAGASYYGVMELTGNVFEMVISTGSVQARLFNGDFHGDGFVSATFPPNTWPSISSTPIGAGTGIRGGAYNCSNGPDGEIYPFIPELLQVSRRPLVNFDVGISREPFVGGRLVRSDF